MIKENPKNVLYTEKWLSDSEIFQLLSNVEYIIMAQPNLHEKAAAKIHFTLFLNTSDNLPQEIITQIINKFAEENKLSTISELHHEIVDVAFAQTSQSTPMPYFADLQEYDNNEKPGTTKNLVIDFKANSQSDYLKTNEGLTGWSYVYSD